MPISGWAATLDRATAAMLTTMDGCARRPGCPAAAELTTPQRLPPSKPRRKPKISPRRGRHRLTGNRGRDRDTFGACPTPAAALGPMNATTT